jgi:hypothetical protein
MRVGAGRMHLKPAPKCAHAHQANGGGVWFSPRPWPVRNHHTPPLARPLLPAVPRYSPASAPLVALVAPRIAFGLICAALILHLQPEARGCRAALVGRRPLLRPNRSHSYDTHQCDTTNGQERRKLRPIPECSDGPTLPVCGDAATSERDQWTGVDTFPGQMRNLRCRTDDARSHRLAAREDFDVNPLRRDTELRLPGSGI